MKTLIQFMFLLSLLSLASCSAKKVGTTLRVSNSMAISNSTYAGGLVFYGRSTTGKIFSIPVAYGAGSGNSVQIDLDRGEWAISAVGWNGAAVLEGTPSCATITTNLDSMEQTVNLDLDPTNCTDASFGGNNTGVDFKALRVITCGTFYQDITTPNAAFTDSDTYCANNDPDLHAEMKIKAKSVRIFLPTMIPGAPVNTSSPLSECIDLSDGRLTAPTKKIPAAGLPIQVELFDEICTVGNKKIMTGYFLPNGLNATYTNFDHKYFSSTQTKLYLLATLSKRGTTSLLDSMPKLICDSTVPSAPCINIPTVSSNRAIRGGEFFFLKDAGYGTDTCAQLSSASTIEINSLPITIWNPATDCELRGNKIFIRLNEVDIDSCSGCALDVAFSPVYSITIDEIANPEALDAYNLIFSTVGYQDYITNGMGATEINGMLSLRSFHNHETRNDNDKKFFGQLSRVREMLMPSGLGGIFQGLTSTDLLNKAYTLSFWEDGTQKSYRVTSQAETGLIPNYIFDDTDSRSVGNTTVSYTHKITISRIVGGAFYPEEIIRIKHGSKVGMLESLEVDADVTETKTHRDLLFWNTEAPNDARFENYSYERTVVTSTPSVVLNVRTSFTRAEREQNNQSLRIDQFAFDSTKNGATYNERAQKSSVTLLIGSGGKALYKNSSAENNASPTFLSYFSKDFFKDFNAASSETPQSGFARAVNSTNGNEYSIQVIPEYNGTSGYWDFKIIRKSAGTVVIESLPTGSVTMPVPKVSINIGGEATVAWVKFASSLYYVYAMTWNGTNWVQPTLTTDANATVAAGIISLTGGAIASQGSMLKVDVADANPNSASSAKAIAYSNFNSNWEIKTRQFTGGSWASAVTPIATTELPLDLTFVKGASTHYYITHTYLDAPDYYVKVSKVDLAGNEIDYDFDIIAATSPSLITKFNSGTTTLGVYVIDYTNQNNNEQATYNSGTLSSVTPLAVANYRFNFIQTPYCFDRTIGSPAVLGDSNDWGTAADCNAPDTSFAPPIKNGFKFNIESLHPTTFSTLFSIN